MLALIAGLATGLSDTSAIGTGWVVFIFGVVVVFAALAVFLILRGVSHTRRRAFYLYPQGYLFTSRTREVAWLTRWENVRSVSGFTPGTKAVTLVINGGATSNVFSVDHFEGRPTKFSEKYGKEELAPLMFQLQQMAVGQAR